MTPPNGRAGKLIRRTLTGAAIGTTVGALVWLADYIGSSLPVLVVGALLAAACAVELARMPRIGPSLGAPAIFGALTVAGLWASLGLFSSFDRGPAGVLFATLAVGAVSALLRPVGRTAPSVGPTHWVALWATLPLPLLAWVHTDFGTRGLVALIVLSKVGDIAGYYVGSAIGKHHPFKRLSPGKTTEGCLGSLAAGGLAGALLAHFGALPGAPGVLAGLLFGLAINLAAQAGDLLESHVKRTAGVKDSSPWLGASGGFLDVVDSLLLTTPVAILLWHGPLG